VEAVGALRWGKKLVEHVSLSGWDELGSSGKELGESEWEAKKRTHTVTG
jgi:hypothetical protein